MGTGSLGTIGSGVTMSSLSVLIAARNEMFLNRTIESLLENMRGDTNIIAVLDGYWPDEPVKDDSHITLIHHCEPVGQRVAVNEAARLSQSKYIMKLDAHCAVDEGFDVKLMQACEYDWTVIPRMYNLHGFDWECAGCGERTYQGPKPEMCIKCNGTEHKMTIMWKPRLRRRTDFARFDHGLHFQYWRDYEKRPESKGDIADVMCSVGAGWMMQRKRYWELGGLDEGHGSWGQMGVEIACKTWLSGGRQVVNKQTWFSHLFRTQNGFGFPYSISYSEQEKAREHSRDLWMKNKWGNAVRKLDWLIDKFSPVPGWENYDWVSV